VTQTMQLEKQESHTGTDGLVNYFAKVEGE
jgi:hypothetical protein